jgi:hypothetical protein
MRSISIVVVFAAALALAASAGGQAEPSVLCWNKDNPPPTGDQPPAVKIEPKKCAFFKKGESSEAGAVNTKALTWKNWGSSKTTGKGKLPVPMTDEVAPVVVRLSKPVSSASCDTDVYSKASFTFPDANDTFGFKLYTSCNT